MSAPKVTHELIQKWIKAGVGQGFGQNYKPGMDIRRWNPSGVSVQVAGGVPPDFRRGAYFSKNEWLVGLVLSWIEVNPREQYPIWPWKHPHMLWGLDRDLDSVLPWSEGMMALCEESGINHGVFPGTSIPYIWTIDYTVYLRQSDGSYLCGLVSVKPVEDGRYQDPDPLDRVLEKLEGERRYAQTLNLPYCVAGSSEFPNVLLTQLECLRGTAVLPETDFRYTLLQSFLDRFVDEARETPPMEWVRWLMTEFKVSYEHALFVCQHVIWHQLVDFDLTHEIDYNRLPQPGGRSLNARIRKLVFGGCK